MAAAEAKLETTCPEAKLTMTGFITPDDARKLTDKARKDQVETVMGYILHRIEREAKERCADSVEIDLRSVKVEEVLDGPVHPFVITIVERYLLQNGWGVSFSDGRAPKSKLCISWEKPVVFGLP